MGCVPRRVQSSLVELLYLNRVQVILSPMSFQNSPLRRSKRSKLTSRTKDIIRMTQ
jgi:hypothetical protein